MGDCPKEVVKELEQCGVDLPSIVRDLILSMGRSEILHHLEGAIETLQESVDICKARLLEGALLFNKIKDDEYRFREAHLLRDTFKDMQFYEKKLQLILEWKGSLNGTTPSGKSKLRVLRGPS